MRKEFKAVYLPVRFFKKEAYILLEDYKQLQEENKRLEEENKKLKDSNTILMKGGQAVFTLEKRIDELLEENKKLKEDLENMRDYCSNLDSENDEQALEIEDLKREIEKLKETIKDHQLYEEKLEHRIIEFEELLHGE